MLKNPYYQRIDSKHGTQASGDSKSDENNKFIWGQEKIEKRKKDEVGQIEMKSDDGKLLSILSVIALNIDGQTHLKIIVLLDNISNHVPFTVNICKIKCRKI